MTAAVLPTSSTNSLKTMATTGTKDVLFTDVSAPQCAGLNKCGMLKRLCLSHRWGEEGAYGPKSSEQQSAFMFHHPSLLLLCLLDFGYPKIQMGMVIIL
jgi:hypothetical protein